MIWQIPTNCQPTKYSRHASAVTLLRLCDVVRMHSCGVCTPVAGGVCGSAYAWQTCATSALCDCGRHVWGDIFTTISYVGRESNDGQTDRRTLIAANALLPEGKYHRSSLWLECNWMSVCSICVLLSAMLRHSLDVSILLNALSHAVADPTGSFTNCGRNQHGKVIF